MRPESFFASAPVRRGAVSRFIMCKVATIAREGDWLADIAQFNEVDRVGSGSRSP